MRLNVAFSMVLFAASAGAPGLLMGQAATPAAAADALPPPAFDVATIKPSGPKGSAIMGFYSRPGGRVLFGNSTAKTILFYAFNISPDQISGGPAWVSTDRYDIEAIPPDTSASRTAKQASVAATPSSEQRMMLQTLLADRFGLKAHMETREGDVYLLSRGTGKLQLEAPKDKDADPRGGVTMKQGGVVDGEAHGTNLSMALLTSQLSRLLRLPVIDQTGITGNYDYDLPAVDTENHDVEAAILDAMHRLGLNLKRGKGPVDILVIDHIEKPTAN